ncbi:hypothetical protein [Curtobacterium sp. CT11-133]|uniref:hypothetical protein n=1 Tax=Curtobacterium sp. CT11-133 TaxID=3243014 RepID=UPI0039B10D29
MTYIESNQRTPGGLPLFAVGVTSLRPVNRGRSGGAAEAARVDTETVEDVVRGPRERIVDAVEHREQHVVRSNAFRRAGELCGTGQHPRRGRCARDTVGRDRPGCPGSDEGTAGGADAVRRDAVRVEDVEEAGHPAAERDRGDEEVLGVEEAEPGLQ